MRGRFAGCPSMRARPACGWPTAYSGHSPSKMACHERTLRFAEAKRKVSVPQQPAAGRRRVSAFDPGMCLSSRGASLREPDV